MLNDVFLKILNMNVTASYVIAIVIVVRALLSLTKTPKVFSYALWTVVLFRLLLPFSFESPFSIPALQAASSKQLTPSPTHFTTISELQHQTTDTVGQIGHTISGQISPTLTKTPIFSGNVFALIWVFGTLALLLHSLYALHKLKQRLTCATHQGGHIFLMDRLETAFVLGVFHPKIYLPTGLSDAETRYILLHEETHLKRFDHIIKRLSHLLLCVHWFNPLVWVAFTLSGRDMEMSCDERVISQLGNQVKKEYSTSILMLATGKHRLTGTPLAFAEGDTKGRIQNVLHYKKPAFWVLSVTALVVLFVCIGLAANPRTKHTADELQSDWVADLYEFRTPYIGNASNVGHICGQLRMLQSLEGKGMRLETTNPPYALNLNYALGIQALPDKSKESAQFYYNAVILFSLVENLDVVRLVVDDAEFISCTRDFAEAFMGENLWNASQTLDEFRALVTEVPVKYALATQSSPADLIHKVLDESVATILSSPPTSSHVQDYIDCHRSAFDKILSYGNDALLYCFERFEQGGQTGLEGQLFMTICRTLCADEDIDLAAKTGQEWYDTFKEHAIKMEQTLSAEEFQKQLPNAQLLLQYLNHSLPSDTQIQLLDFSYRGNDKILKLVYETELTQNRDYRPTGSFWVPAVHIHGSYDEGNVRKIFATIFNAHYSLRGNELTETGGSIIPVALSYTKSKDGYYALTDYVSAQDGSYFEPSIRQYCTYPTSGKEIPGLADEIMAHYSDYDDLRALQRSNLIEHLKANGLSGIVLTNEYDDTKIPLA